MSVQQIEAAYGRAILLHNCLQDMSHDELAHIDQAIATTKERVKIHLGQIEDQLRNTVQRAIDDLPFGLYTNDQALWQASFNRDVVEKLEICHQRIVQNIQIEIQTALLQEIDKLHAFATTVDCLMEHIETHLPTLAIQKFQQPTKLNSIQVSTSIITKFGNLWHRYKTVELQTNANNFSDPQFIFGAGTLLGLLQLPLLAYAVLTFGNYQIEGETEELPAAGDIESLKASYRKDLVLKLEKQFRIYLPALQHAMDGYITVFFSYLKRDIDISLREIRGQIDQHYQISP